MRCTIGVYVALLAFASGCPSGPPAWHVVQEGLDGSILSIWGESTSELFAVGGPLSDPGEAFILHYDGAQWTRMPAPAGSPTLWWVYGFGPTDVWAVGMDGVILHFDGDAWSTVEEPTHAYTLWGVWGASPTSVWTIGGVADGSGPSVIRHYDGTLWEDVPDIGVDRELLFKVWGTAEDNIYVVGTTDILHYDGSAWARTPSPTTSRLLTLRGRGPDDIYAVGGSSAAVVVHYDGSAWSEIEVEPVGGLMGVWTAPNQPVVVSGRNGAILWDDGDGFVVVEDSARATFRDLHVTWGDGDGTFMAGGGVLFPGPSPDGVLVGVGEIEGGAVGTWAP